ncbi:MAG: hypothetical protein L0Y60_11950, partial [Beijerinckiaceae bacterium]|nr:hypothetical protein [Beijerinckiaceae bacterium]
RGLIRLMQQESAFSGLFSASMMRRLRTLAEARTAAEMEQKAQTALRLKVRGHLRRVERIVKQLESDAERSETSRELAETTASVVPRMTQGPCKLARSSSEKWDLTRDIRGVDKPGFGYRPRRRQGG